MNDRSFCNCKGDKEEQKRLQRVLYAINGHPYCVRCKKCGGKRLCEVCIEHARAIDEGYVLES